MRSVLQAMTWRRWLAAITACTTVAAVVWLGVSAATAYQLTRRPRPAFAEPAPPIEWAKLDELRLTTRDGEQIGAWFVDAGRATPVVVFAHAHGECRTVSLPRARLLAELGASSLLLSLRSYGDSSGESTDFGYGARADMVAAVEWIEAEHPERDVLLAGYSIGAAASVFAAAELGSRIKGCLLECAYQDLETAVCNRLALYLPPPVDHVAYACLTTTAPIILPQRKSISPVSAIGRIDNSAPVWILAGRCDERARPDEARALFDELRGERRLVWFDEAEHESLLAHDGAHYRRTLAAWLARCTKAARAIAPEDGDE